MTRWERAFGWLLASVGVLAFAGIVVVLVVVGQQNSQTAHQAELNQADTSARSYARITSLTRTADNNAAQLASDSRQIGELLADVAALEAQVRQLGASPVVTPPSSTSTKSGARSTASSSSATTTTSTSTTTTTVPPECERAVVVEVCRS